MTAVKIRKHKAYWTKERLAKEAKRFSSRLEFRRASASAYTTASHKKILDQICSHMVEGRRKSGHWTLETLSEEAKKYSTLKDFRENSPVAYQSARQRGLLVRVTSGLDRTKPGGHPTGAWTKQRVIKEAEKFSSLSDFAKYSSAAYRKALREGWKDRVCAHMRKGRANSGYWNLPRCRDEAVKYVARTKFQHGSPSAYAAARRNGWLQKICSHMPIRVKKCRTPRSGMPC